MKKFFPLLVLFLFFPFLTCAFDSEDLTLLMQEYENGGIQIGLHVISLSDGRTLFAHHESWPLNPASNMKVITTATALTRLGSNSMCKTRFLSDLPPNGGRIENLYVVGGGDPGLVQEHLWDIASAIAVHVKEIGGDIVVDQSFFDRHTDGAGFGGDGNSRAYTAPITALALNFNSFAVASEGGKISIDPASDYFQLQNRVHGKRRGGFSVTRKFVDGKEVVTVSGSARNGMKIWRNVSHPSLYAGYTLKEYLRQNGVRVEGLVREGPARGNYVIEEASSKPLKELIQELNKISNNFMAETILKDIGARMKGPPGTTAKGVTVLREYLDSIGVSSRDTVLENGSGFSDNARLTPRVLTRVLYEMYHQPSMRNDFMDSLAIAGVDGTVKGRLKDDSIRGRVLVKTGTLNHVSSLSGYVPEKNLAFALIVNGPTASSYRYHNELQEKVVMKLAR